MTVKPTLYFACAITGNGDLRTYDLKEAIAWIEAAGFEVMLPPMTTSSECYIEDLGMIDNADGVLFYIPRPSTGMGIEMEYCRHYLPHDVLFPWKCAYDNIEDLSPFVVGFWNTLDREVSPSIKDLIYKLKEKFYGRRS